MVSGWCGASLGVAVQIAQPCKGLHTCARASMTAGQWLLRLFLVSEIRWEDGRLMSLGGENVDPSFDVVQAS